MTTKGTRAAINSAQKTDDIEEHEQVETTSREKPWLGRLDGVPDRSRKKPGPRDLNELAAAIVRRATGQAPDEPEERLEDGDEAKDPAAVELGRRGGKKGGKARAERMTPEERSEAARKAARARWGYADENEPGN